MMLSVTCAIVNEGLIMLADAAAEGELTEEHLVMIRELGNLFVEMHKSLTEQTLT